jgi:hypothetical protein
MGTTASARRGLASLDAWHREATKPIKPTDRNRTMSTALTAKSLKVAMALVSAAIRDVPVRNGDLRTVITIAVAGRVVFADLSSKSIRKAHVTLAEHGLDGVQCVLQGKLAAGNSLADAGLAAQIKTQPAVEKAAAS